MRSIRLSSLLAVSFLLLATSAYAFGEIRYPDRPLNLRSGRSARAGWVGTLYPGQKVRIAHLKDGWVAIYEPDETRDTSGAVVGYSNVKYLKKKRTRHEPKEWGELVYTPQTLNVRNKPSLRGKRVTKLQAGQHVKVDFPDGDWVRVFPPDATIRSEMGGFGYSSNKYFKPATNASMARAGLGGAPEPEPEVVVEKKPEPPSLTLKEITKTINVRQSRTSVSPLVKTLQPGDLIKIGLARSGWYAVFSKDETVVAESKSIGYALESLVDAGSQAPTAKPAVEEEPEVRAAVTPPAPEPAPEPAPKPEPISQPKPAVEPESVLAAEPEPVVEAVAPVEKADPVVAPEPKAELVVQSKGKQQVMHIDPKSFSGGKRPDPTPDKMAHGYKFKIMVKAETRQLGESWISLKVFLATTKLPSAKALKDFSTTLWKENRQVTKNLAVQIYLPGMDTDDLAYGVIKFSDEQMLEYWVRKATLFGTDFM